MKQIDHALLDKIVAEAVARKNIFGAVMCVEKGDDTFSFVSGGGNIQADDLYFIASVTKLYITAIVLKLRAQNLLQLDDKISTYLSQDILNELHILHGVDDTNKITIMHLLSHTSGIPDYFTADVVKALVKGNDQPWHLENTLSRVKQMKPKFTPGQSGKIHYSDVNYQLLGRIIENITGKTIHTVLREMIFEKLGLINTYAYHETSDARPIRMHFRDQAVNIPIYMASATPDGGIVSTARESMRFLKAFFSGELFPKDDINEITSHWNLLIFPNLSYFGVGITKQPLSLFSLKRGLLGHWGQSGAFAFYHPETDLYFTGTVNQFFGHAVAASMMRKVINHIKS